MPPKNKSLEDILKVESRTKSNFPGKKDYSSIYKTFAEFLDDKIHKHVGLVTMRANGSYLTDHGPEHIATVIQRAADILGPKPMLHISPYELFILLAAIQVHDAGHVKGGRQGHEKAANELLDKLEVTPLERRLIYSVAKVHGGQVEGSDKDKDTIGQINTTGKVGNETVRIQFLAALLRFSDELADDYSRAATYLLETSDILGTSEIYHAYAAALTVDVNRAENEVNLNFELTREMAVKIYEKETGRTETNEPITAEQFLLEEIYERTFKMYMENIYCMRFIPSNLRIQAINVTITAFTDGYSTGYGPIKYILKERGYPNLVAKSVMDMCAKDLIIDEIKLTGERLKYIIENAVTV